MTTTAGPSSPNETTLPFVVAGTVTLDTLHLPSGRHDRLPGGSAVYGALGASTVAPCVLLGRCGVDLTEDALAPLVDRGIDLAGLEWVPGSSFQWEARYTDDLKDRVTVLRELGVGREPPTVGTALRDSAWAFFGSMPPTVQQSLVAAMGPRLRYGVDTMGHWARNRRSDVLSLVKGAEVLFVSEDEVQSLTEQDDVDAAIPSLLASGVGQIVAKAGSGGARVFLADGTAYRCPSFPVHTAIDPTGAGDVLGGAYLASLMRGNSPAQSLAMGIAAASFAVERVSIASWSEVGASVVRKRTEWTLAHVEPIHPL